MIQEYYSVYDKKTGIYSNPFPAPSQGFAVRECKALILDSSTMFSKFPQDYILHFCGKFDTLLGIFILPSGDELDLDFVHICSLISTDISCEEDDSVEG